MHYSSTATVPMLSSSVLLFCPVLSTNSISSSPAPPRVKLPPPIAVTTRTTTASYSKPTRTSPTPRLPMASCASLYAILGIPIGASSEEIKTAYRRLARVCHPDVAAIDRKDSSADAFIKIHTAYCTLSDPQKRAVYDQKLFRRSRPLTAVSGFSGYAGRNWETDQCW